jgi:hypothetical protein
MLIKKVIFLGCKIEIPNQKNITMKPISPLLSAGTVSVQGII